MKRIAILCSMALAMTFSSCLREDYVKVACVGDSITEGMTIEWQSDNAYPSQLDAILGDGYEVLNLGRSSTTMMRNGDFPYWSAKEFSDVLRYHPDIIVIKLGTNDAKLKQWDPESYRSSYQAMIDTFRSISPVPTIKLCLPVAPQQTRWEITDSVVSGFVNPIVRELAERNGLELIDLYDAIGHDASLFSKDGIHPNKEGAKRIAEEVARHIRK